MRRIIHQISIFILLALHAALLSACNPSSAKAEKEIQFSEKITFRAGGPNQPCIQVTARLGRFQELGEILGTTSPDLSDDLKISLRDLEAFDLQARNSTTALDSEAFESYLEKSSLFVRGVLQIYKSHLNEIREDAKEEYPNDKDAREEEIDDEIRTAYLRLDYLLNAEENRLSHFARPLLVEAQDQRQKLIDFSEKISTVRKILAKGSRNADGALAIFNLAP